MSDRTNITDEIQRKIDAIRALDPADPDVSADHGPCRLNPGEDASLRRAKEEKVVESLLVRKQARQGDSQCVVPGDRSSDPPSREESTKRPFAHGAYHYTLAIARLSVDPPEYQVSLDRSSSDRTETARVTDKQYALPGSRQRYAGVRETEVTSRLMDYLQQLIEGGHPLPDELPADWNRHADEPLPPPA